MIHDSKYISISMNDNALNFEMLGGCLKPDSYRLHNDYITLLL